MQHPCNQAAKAKANRVNLKVNHTLAALNTQYPAAKQPVSAAIYLYQYSQQYNISISIQPLLICVLVVVALRALQFDIFGMFAIGSMMHFDISCPKTAYVTEKIICSILYQVCIDW
jgi:hypothetical protein